MKSFIHSCAKRVSQDSFLSLTFEFYALFSGKHEITTDTFGSALNSIHPQRLDLLFLCVNLLPFPLIHSELYTQQIGHPSFTISLYSIFAYKNTHNNLFAQTYINPVTLFS